MPIYDYQCGSCGHRFELRQGFDAEPVAECPKCAGAARRRFHVPTVIYKGSGFYTTDYKRKESNASSTDGAKPTVSPKKDSEPGSSTSEATTEKTTSGASEEG